MSVQLQQTSKISTSSGGVPPSESKGHASQQDANSLKEKMLRAANLVAADATRQSSPKALAQACGLTDSGPSSVPYDDEGGTYLLIRQAFCSAFDEVIKQTHGSRQSSVEELWAALADYLDRMHARQDVAFNDATVQFAITAELERQLRLANARYKELQHEVSCMKVQMAGPGQERSKGEDGHRTKPVTSAADVTPEECSVPVPQPAQDRSVLGLVQHQMPMTPCGGQATSPISPADARRSQRSAALMRLANEGILVDTSLPQSLALALAGPSVDVPSATEDCQMTTQQQTALEEARAEAVQQGLLKAERERSMARQRGIQHQLQEQLDSMYRRTACIDSPVQLSGAAYGAANPADSPSQAGSGLSAAGHTAVQGTPQQGGFPMRAVPARPVTEPEHGLQTHSMPHQAMQGNAPAAYRPRSIAQKAGMSVWSRHGSRYGHNPPQGRRECSIPDPEDVPLTDACPGPLAQGLAAAAKGRQSPARLGKPRHMLLSTSVDTVLGDVFAETTSASETIAAGPQQDFMSFVRGSQGHMGARSSSRCQAEAATASVLAQPAARWPLHPEEIALVLAEQPSAQALVSEDILSPLVSPAGGQAQSMRGRADVGGGPPGAQRRGAADISITTAHALRSPPALASPMQLARASIQQWGKPRGSVSPSSESMVICGPTWSFPVETSSPTRSSAREPQAALRPAHLGSTAPSAALQGPSRSGVDHYSCDVDEGNMAMQPEERSISFRCRQVTASLPDMAALQAAIRGQPRPGQPDAERAESRLLPDVAVAERALTLQSLQAAAEQVSASCALDSQASDQATQQAPWPLKKGAWDRIQQGARSAKPETWHVNEAAAVSLDLQAALTVQPKQTSFEQAANAALAAFAGATPQGVSTAAVPASHSVEQEALSASITSSEQGKQPLHAEAKAPSTRSAAAGAASPGAASKQKDLSASKLAEAKRVAPRASATGDAAAATRAAARNQGVAQRLLARANCFAALAQSPAKESTRIEPLPAANSPAAAAPANPAPDARSQNTGAAEATTAGNSSPQGSTREPAPALSASRLGHEDLAASTLAQQAQTGNLPMAEAAKEEEPARSPDEASSVSISAFSTVTQRRRATLFGESAGKVSPQSPASESSQLSMPSIARLVMRSSGGCNSSVAQVLSVTSGSARGSISSEEKLSRQGNLSGAESAASRSPSPIAKQSLAVTEPGPAKITAQGALPPLPCKNPSAASQGSFSPPGGALSGSSNRLPTAAEEKPPPPATRSKGDQQQPLSFDIHASCQATSITVASAAVDSRAAAQQPFQRVSPSKASPAPAPAMLWPGQRVCESPPGRSADAEKPAITATGAPGSTGSAGHAGSPERNASKDPLQLYSASVDSAQKTARAAADRLGCLPASPQVEAGGEESRSVSDIQFSSDSDADEDQSSSAAGQRHTEDSEWDGSSLLTTGEEAARGDAAEAECADITRPSSEEEMYTAHSEAFQTAAPETSPEALQEVSLAARVEESISESTEVLMQTGSDTGLEHAELEVTCAQVITSTAAGLSHAESTTEDRELDAMLASVLGAGSGQPSAQPDQEAPPCASTSQAQHDEQPLKVAQPAKMSAADDGDDMRAFHLPDNLFGSPLAGAVQDTDTFATKEANSESEDDVSFMKKPKMKNRKGRRAGRK